MREACALCAVSKLVEASFDRRVGIHRGKGGKSLLNTYFSLCPFSVFI